MRRTTRILGGWILAMPVLAAMWCVGIVHADTPTITVKSMMGNVPWTGKGPGLGSFSLLATVPTTITNLKQLATAQPSFLFHSGWPGLNLWDEWLIKDSGTTRTYAYKGRLNGRNTRYNVTLSLANGTLTIKINAAVRDYVAGMFGLADTTSSGTASFTYMVDMKDTGGTSVVVGSAVVQVNYENKAGKKSSAKLKKE